MKYAINKDRARKQGLSTEIYPILTEYAHKPDRPSRVQGLSRCVTVTTLLIRWALNRLGV